MAVAVKKTKEPVVDAPIVGPSVPQNNLKKEHESQIRQEGEMTSSSSGESPTKSNNGNDDTVNTADLTGGAWGQLPGSKLAKLMEEQQQREGKLPPPPPPQFHNPQKPWIKHEGDSGGVGVGVGGNGNGNGNGGNGGNNSHHGNHMNNNNGGRYDNLHHGINISNNTLTNSSWWKRIWELKVSS